MQIKTINLISMESYIQLKNRHKQIRNASLVGFMARNVHFGSCSTLKMREEDIKKFKQLTKARMITGYTKDVDLTSSFIFEAWLMDAIKRNEGYAAKRINDLAEKEMPYFTKLFGFKAF